MFRVFPQVHCLDLKGIGFYIPDQNLLAFFLKFTEVLAFCLQC